MVNLNHSADTGVVRRARDVVIPIRSMENINHGWQTSGVHEHGKGFMKASKQPVVTEGKPDKENGGMLAGG